MKQSWWLVAIVACDIVFLSYTLRADDGGFKFPSMSLFSSGEEAPPKQKLGARVTDEHASSSGITWPTLPKTTLPSLPKTSLPKLSLPSLSASPVSQKSNVHEPSMWDKMNNGTKSLYSKTKQTLMPWTADDASSTTKHPVRTGSRPKSKTTNKKSILSSWLGQTEDKKSIKTVNDYLSLPRVPYE